MSRSLTIRNRFFKAAHVLFILTLLIGALPDRAANPSPLYAVVFVLTLEALLLVSSALLKDIRSINLIAGIIAFVYFFILLWTLFTAKLDMLKASFFPPSGTVAAQMLSDGGVILGNIKTSLGIVVQGYAIALVTAIPPGLFLGWNIRSGSAAIYISKFVGSIPPVVYIPYGIALLPTFRSVSVMVIFLASFWPILAGTMSGVLNVEMSPGTQALRTSACRSV